MSDVGETWEEVKNFNVKYKDNLRTQDIQVEGWGKKESGP